MSVFTRGFTGRKAARDGRLPPGQYDAGSSWPVLTAELAPKIDLVGRVKEELRLLELTANLDALTGGQFSGSVARGGSAR